MRTTRVLIAVICVVFGFSMSWARILNADSITSRIMYRTWSYPQEKIYLVTDRDSYMSGDTMRLRAFLVNASNHNKPAYPSRFIYVELTDPFGENVKRVKIKDTDDGFAGVMPLDAEMAEGTYTLSAYTQFMQNVGKEYFYRQSLPVFSQLSKKYRLKTDINDDCLTVNLVENGSNKPVRVERISITGRNGEDFARGARKRNSYSLKLNDSMRKSGSIKVKFDRYEKFIIIPDDNKSLSVTFHPEGGYIIPGVRNKLAFKALGSNGLSSDFKGQIIDDRGILVDSIASSHRGMGAIDFTPKPNRTYSAIVNGISFPVPEANPEATVIRINKSTKDSITLYIIGKKRNGMSLISHNGGIVTFAKDINSTDSISLKRDALGSGINQLLLCDSNGNILSSRMLFNHGGYIYGSSEDSIPDGDYAIKAFRDFVPDNSRSIVSELLLQSDLKGHIEDPDYYFIDRDSITDSNLDLLLLTQGWERYDLQSALKGKFGEPDIPLEIGGEITGTVKSRWLAKPLADAMVMLIAPDIDFATYTLTDREGNFTFNGFDWPDGTRFFIQVSGPSGKKEHNYDVANDQFPSIDALRTENMELSPDESVDDLALSDGTILLDEIEVIAPLSPEETRQEMLRALGVKSFSSDEIEKMHATSYEDIIRKIPGLRIINGNVVSPHARGTYNTGSGGSLVELWIDGTRWAPSYSHSSGSLAHSGDPEPVGQPFRHEHTYVEIMNNTLNEFSSIYPFNIIKTIEYYKPSTALIISMSAADKGGALVMTTKDGSEIKDADHNLFIREFKPLGFSNAAEAYEPHYIYDATKDGSEYKAVWIPVTKNMEPLSGKKGLNTVIEGITDKGIPLTVRLNSDK